MDTDTLSPSDFLLTSRQELYDQWLEEGGSQSSVACQNRTQELLCQDAFPPCQDTDDYAVFPCKENCVQYQESSSNPQIIHRLCQSAASPLICPTDGPDSGSITPGQGVYPLSNNALWSCFRDDGSIQPFPFRHHPKS